MAKICKMSSREVFSVSLYIFVMPINVSYALILILQLQWYGLVFNIKIS